MEGFWSVINQWDGIFQFMFLWIVLDVMLKALYYIVAGIRGWPTNTNIEESEEEDG
jgi:hypothetical protein